MRKLEYKIKLKLRTPLVIGGKKLGNNYIKSMDYIPGSVFRAALAREILNRCPYYDGGRNKIYWVEFKNQNQCGNCRLRNLCKDFSNLKIDTLYPLGGKPYPNTNMRCKYNSSHGNVDMLLYKINRHIGVNIPYNGQCPICNERLEKHDGLGKDGRDIEGIYTLITKNGVNPYIKASRDGVLYSLDVLNERIFLDDEERDTEFEGAIESNLDILEDLKHIGTLRIGAYTTSGFGKCTFYSKIAENKENIQTLKNRIEKFNSYIENGQRFYISLDLLSDAYLGLEDTFSDSILPFAIGTEEFVNKYEEKLKDYIGGGLKLEIPMVNNEWRRGFDTSQRVSTYRRAKIVSKSGSVFVFSIAKDKIDYEKLLQIQCKGIGDNREHGFGKIEICPREHIDNRMKTRGYKE